MVANQQVNNHKIISYNPSNMNVLGEVDVSTAQDIEQVVSNAREAQKLWHLLGVEKRIEHIKALIPLFKMNREDLIKQTSQEMGMPNGMSMNIVDGAIASLEWNCEHAKKFLSNEITFDDGKEINEIIYEPYGVAACIVAWNFPLGNFVMSASQALLSGNSVVMKYSEEVPLFSKLLENIIAQANLPAGVMSFVYGGGQVGEILTNQNIDFMSFTGSSQTGRKLYVKAADKFIPIALELGGSSPGVVFEDVIIDDTFIKNLFWARFSNTAQFCDNMKRLIVHESLFEECVSKLCAYAKTIKIGDPLNENVEMGPLVAERQVIKLEEQVADAVNKGAELICGGKRPDNLQGTFFEPTILTNITKDMKVWKEEVFGPALPVVSFNTYEEAMELANDTEYGLTASVFTNNKTIAMKAFSDIKAGGVSSNENHFYRSDNPFGGYKSSGIGRQGGKIGFHEACQVKVVARDK